jgi:hypothetical protein
MKIPLYTQGPSGLVLRCAWWIGKTEGGTNLGWSGGGEMKGGTKGMGACGVVGGGE